MLLKSQIILMGLAIGFASLLSQSCAKRSQLQGKNSMGVRSASNQEGTQNTAGDHSTSTVFSDGSSNQSSLPGSNGSENSTLSGSGVSLQNPLSGSSQQQATPMFSHVRRFCSDVYMGLLKARISPLNNPLIATAILVRESSNPRGLVVEEDPSVGVSVFQQLRNSNTMNLQVRAPANETAYVVLCKRDAGCLNDLKNLVSRSAPTDSADAVVKRFMGGSGIHAHHTKSFGFFKLEPQAAASQSSRPYMSEYVVVVDTGSNPQPHCDQTLSPLLLSLDGGDIEMSSRDEGVAFDLLGNGTAVKTSWPLLPKNRPQGMAGFLAIDLNGDRKISSALELFGNESGWRAEAGLSRAFHNGFEALSFYDKNHDGRIDELDAVYKNLLVWVDSNRDGVSQPIELKNLAQLNISRIFLNYNEQNFIDQHGNQFRQWGRFVLGGQLHRVIDVWLNFKRLD